MKRLIANSAAKRQVIVQQKLACRQCLCQQKSGSRKRFILCGGSKCLSPWSLGFQNRNNGLGIAPFHTTSIQFAYQLKKDLKDCYQLLNVDPENTNISDIKEAFLKQAKEYHPDSRSKTADVRKFNQVQEAYQAIRTDLEAKTLRQVKSDDRLDFDIEHTAPQHRQYLEFEGIGSGTPSQRQSNYQKFRVQRAMNSVSEHQIEKLVVDKEASVLISLDKKAAKKIKTTNMIDRLVEDLIKEAMIKGEFDNLQYTGKPLPDKISKCPYWDVREHNLNQVLVNNGYVPEWIQTEREIRGQLRELKSELLKARVKLGPEPLNSFNRNKWQNLKDGFTKSIQTLNKKVERRNLIVPVLQLQMVHLRSQKEIDKVQKEYEEETQEELEKPVIREPSSQGEEFNTNFLRKIGDKIFHKIFFSSKDSMED